MKRKNLGAMIVLVFCLLLFFSTYTYAQGKPSFVIVTSGFWGSMDQLPSNSPEWLATSPYPHYKKHQDASFLNGPDYIPIPQSMLCYGQGPSVGVLIINAYYMMRHEFDYWAKQINQKSGREHVKIFDDWQTLEKGASISDINIIYLKFDWRLEFPQIEQYYVKPLVSFIDQHWQDAELHWVGHSVGGVVGRYAVSANPGRFTSLFTVGAPHYGIYEIGAEQRGESVTFGGRWDMVWSQEFGLWVTEKMFFRTNIVRLGPDFNQSAVDFFNKYVLMMRWLDPKQNLLSDGFGTLTKLKDAVPHAIALYGLGFGSYDLQGNYHPRFIWGKGIGPGRGPEYGPPEYALTGDGRVDPISARGPFTNTLCIGMDMSHGSEMWSPLVLTALFDRYLFNGEMPEIKSGGRCGG